MRVNGLPIERLGVINHGHFIYNNGDHGSIYISEELLMTSPLNLNRMCGDIADRYTVAIDEDGSVRSRLEKIDVVIGLAPNGAILANRVAESLQALSMREVVAIYAEKATNVFDQDGRSKLIIRPIFRLFLGEAQRVLVVDDFIKTGRTVKMIAEDVRSTGAEVVSVAALMSQDGITAESLGVPSLYSLVDYHFDVFSPEACPLCAENIPINLELGYGGGFQLRKPDYQGGYVRALRIWA